MVNKLIILKIPKRDNRGNIIPNAYKATTGICTYFGPNDNLNIPLQVCIGRTPFRLKHVTDILHVYESKPDPYKLYFDLIRFNEQLG